MRRWPKKERYQVVAGLLLFAFPAVVFAVSPLLPLPNGVVLTLPGFVLLGPGIYWHLTRPDSSDDQCARTTSVQATEDQPTETDEQEQPTERAELIAANYNRLSEESQKRDDFLINANYFSLAVIAVLIGMFFQVGETLRPLIAMTGAATAYSFWLATESYKGARDSLNDSMRRNEDRYSELSVVSDYDTRERSPVGKRSLSSFFIGLQSTTTLLWASVYFVFVVKFAYM